MIFQMRNNWQPSLPDLIPRL